MQAFVKHIKEQLSSLYPKDEIRVFIRLLLDKVCGIPPYRQLYDKDIKLSDTQAGCLNSCIERLLNEEPIQYILGETEFFGYTLNVAPGVLIPRPETEEMAALIVKAHENRKPKILDIGTGSGCIALSLAKKINGAEVYAIDVSDEALAVARKNAARIDVDVKFLLHDVFALLPKAPLLPDFFDVIVSNPPYIMERERGAMLRNVLDYEPAGALFVPDHDPLLFYRQIAEVAFGRLAPEGVVYVEINALLGQETVALFKEKGFSDVQIVCDISQKERFIAARR